jgi:hypothetical protein
MAATIPYEDIADEDLRAELQSLGLTIPHTQSVIAPDVGAYDVPFYHKLLAMEAYTYERSEQPDQPGVVEYTPYWETYNAALMGYVKHAPLSKQKLKDVVAGLYGFLSVHYGHGAGNVSTIHQSNAKSIFVMNGFIETVVGRPLAYYDDYIAEDPMATPEPTLASSARLEEDPDVVNTAWDSDLGKLNGLLAKYADAISDVAVNAMFDNTDPNAQGLAITETWDMIFIGLNWKWYIDHFQSTFVIPPRPTI